MLSDVCVGRRPKVMRHDQPGPRLAALQELQESLPAFPQLSLRP